MMTVCQSNFAARLGSNFSRLIASLIVVGVSLFAGEVRAISISSHDADGAIYVATFPAQDLIVGFSSGSQEYNGIAFFELPDLNLGSVSSATLQFTVTLAGSITGANGDIWGLGYVSGTPALNASWRLLADTDAGAGLGVPSRTKLADNIVPAASSLSVNDVVQTDAQAFISSLYTNGAVAGDHAVVRFNHDASVVAGSYRFGGSHQGANASMLTLTLQPVPEPSTFLLLGLGALGLVRLNRRRRRRA